VLGAPLEGRRDPVLSLCGYMLAGGPVDDLRLGPVLVTRDEFPEPPAALRGDAPVAVPEYLRQMEAKYALKSGDVVILGVPQLTDHQRARLSSPRLFEPPLPPAGRRAATPGPGPTA
jgi:hypothetical protein